MKFIDFLMNLDSIVSLRKSIAFIALFGFLSITFALLAGGIWTGSVAYVFFFDCREGGLEY